MLNSLIALPFALLPNAQAAPAPPPKPTFSYTFLQAGVISIEHDAVNESSEGLAFRGSYDITPNVNLTADFGFDSLDVNGLKSDRRDIAFGAGYHMPLHKKVDIYGQAAIVSARIEALGQKTTDTGFSVEAGLRFMPGEFVELNAAVHHMDAGGSTTNLGLGARGYFSDAFSLGLATRLDSDGNAYGVNLRYEF